MLVSLRAYSFYDRVAYRKQDIEAQNRSRLLRRTIGTKFDLNLDKIGLLS